MEAFRARQAGHGGTAAVLTRAASASGSRIGAASGGAFDRGARADQPGRPGAPIPEVAAQAEPTPETAERGASAEPAARCEPARVIEAAEAPGSGGPGYLSLDPPKMIGEF